MSGRLTYLAQTAVPQAIERAGLVRSLFRGDVYDRWNNAAVVRYPAVDFEQVNVEKVSDDLKRYTLRFYVADRLYDDGTGYNGNPIGLPLQPATDANGMVQWQLTKADLWGNYGDGYSYSNMVRPMSNENCEAGFPWPMLPISTPLPDLLEGAELTLPLFDYLPPKVEMYGSTVDLRQGILNYSGENNLSVALQLIVAIGYNDRAYNETTFKYIYVDGHNQYPVLRLVTADGYHFHILEAWQGGYNNRPLINYLKTLINGGVNNVYGYVSIYTNTNLAFYYSDLSTAFQPIPANLPWGMQPTKEVDTFLFDTCEAAIDTLVAELRKDSSILEADYTTLTPFEQKFADNLAGYYTDINIVLPNSLNIC